MKTTYDDLIVKSQMDKPLFEVNWHLSLLFMGNNIDVLT